MSRHEGVSCDACMKGNFTGRRFKCLICYDYDLCSACYEAGAASTRHSAEHPMQCILTRTDFDVYYGGESVSSDQHQSYTCPHCGRMGFTDVLLLEHVGCEHPDMSSEVVCPVCAAYPGGEPNHVIDDLAAHLMLEHRSSNNDLDVQLSGMRAVRRIPHHSRSSANPRTRRAANLQYQSSPGSTLMVLSPGDRDRDAMDPITELLSQLSSVRSRTAAAQSISSQLQQLEMQLHSTRLQADRLSVNQQTLSDNANRATTTIVFPSFNEQSHAITPLPRAPVSSTRDSPEFLLSRVDESKKSESDQEETEVQQADRSLFVQELLLSAFNDQLSVSVNTGDVVSHEPVKLASSPPAKLESSAVQTTAVESGRTVTTTASAPTVDRVVTNTVSRSHRSPVSSAAGPTPPSDGGSRFVPNQSPLPSSRSSAVKRKPLPTNSRPGKDAAPATGNKRH